MAAPQEVGRSCCSVSYIAVEIRFIGRWAKSAQSAFLDGQDSFTLLTTDFGKSWWCCPMFDLISWCQPVIDSDRCLPGIWPISRWLLVFDGVYRMRNRRMVQKRADVKDDDMDPSLHFASFILDSWSPNQWNQSRSVELYTPFKKWIYLYFT